MSERPAARPVAIPVGSSGDSMWVEHIQFPQDLLFQFLQILAQVHAVKCTRSSRGLPDHYSRMFGSSETPMEFPVPSYWFYLILWVPVCLHSLPHHMNLPFLSAALLTLDLAPDQGPQTYTACTASSHTVLSLIAIQTPLCHS